MSARSRGQMTPGVASFASSLTSSLSQQLTPLSTAFFFFFFDVAHELMTEMQKSYYMESKETQTKYVGRIARFQTNTTSEQKEKASAVSWSVTHIQGPHMVTHSLKNSASSFFPFLCTQFCERHGNAGRSPC